MARIKHPHFQPGRVKSPLGVVFVDGFAEVDLTDKPILRQALVQHRYEIDDVPELVEHTVQELRDELKSLGYDVKSSWRKPELVERLAQHRELNTETIVEGDAVEKFAIVELPDSTVIGDGKSIATLFADGRTTAPAATED